MVTMKGEYEEREKWGSGWVDIGKGSNAEGDTVELEGIGLEHARRQSE